MALTNLGTAIAVNDPNYPENQLGVNGDGSLNVGVGGAIGVPSGATGQVSLDTTGTVQIVPARANRTGLLVAMVGSTDAYLGFASGVTTANGFILEGTKGAWVSIPFTGAVYGCASTGSVTVSFMEIWAPNATPPVAPED